MKEVRHDPLWQMAVLDVTDNGASGEQQHQLGQEDRGPL